MTTTKITLETNIVKAHLLIAPKSDIRYYLNGVYVDVANRRLVSTDGHCLLVTRFNDACIEGDSCESFIISRDQLTIGLKACLKGMPIVIEYTQADNYLDAEGRSCRPSPTLTVCNFSGSPVDGKYPEYHRVVPTTINNELAQFNPELANCVSEALQLACNSKKNSPTLFHNGNNPGVMILGSESFGVVMPLRCDVTSSAALAMVDDIMGRNQAEPTEVAA